MASGAGVLPTNIAEWPDLGVRDDACHLDVAYRMASVWRGVVPSDTVVHIDRGAPHRGRLRVFSVFRLRRALRRPEMVIALICLVILGVFIVTPLASILFRTVTVSGLDTRLIKDATSGSLTSYHWWRATSSPMSQVLLYRPLLNTLAVGLGVVLLALPLGAILAWIVARTDIPLRRFFNTAFVLPYLLPSWVNGLVWLSVFKNARIGGPQGLLQGLGVALPDWVAYGYLPIVITLSLHYFPFAFLTVSSALASLDSQVEEAAEILGAKRRTVLRRVSLPLVLPTIGSAFILIICKAMGTFATPAFLGFPVRYYTLSTRIYATLQSREDGTAYVLAVLLVLLSSILILGNAKLLGIGKKFAVIGGQGRKARPVRLGRLRAPLCILLIGFTMCSLVVPLGLVALQTFTQKGDFNLRELTLRTWIGEPDPAAGGVSGVLRNPETLEAALNSVKLSGVSAVSAVALGLLVGYAVAKGRGSKVSKMVEAAAFLPYVIPAIVFSSIYLSMFARSYGPIPGLYGTFLLLVIVTVAKEMPFASRTAVGALMQIDPALEEAAEVKGVSWGTRIRRVVLPLAKPGLLAGMILVFISVMREMTLIVMLVTPRTRTLTFLTFYYVERNVGHFASAIALLILAITLAGYLLIRVVGKPRMGGLR